MRVNQGVNLSINTKYVNFDKTPTVSFGSKLRKLNVTIKFWNGQTVKL